MKKECSMRSRAITIGAAIIVILALHVIWPSWRSNVSPSVCPRSTDSQGKYVEGPHLKSSLSGRQAWPPISTEAKSELPLTQQLSSTSEIPTLPTPRDDRPANNPAPELLRAALSAIVDQARSDRTGAFSNPVANWHKQATEGTEDPTWSPMAQAQAES